MSLRQFSRIALAQIAREARPVAPALVRDGRFDTRAIMRAAVALAKGQFRGCATWRVRMKISLRTIWAKAKAAMAASLAVVPVVAPRSVLAATARCPASQSAAGFTRGSRLHSHGW